jgi:hypothetical protein
VTVTVAVLETWTAYRRLAVDAPPARLAAVHALVCFAGAVSTRCCWPPTFRHPRALAPARLPSHETDVSGQRRADGSSD